MNPFTRLLIRASPAAITVLFAGGLAAAAPIRSLWPQSPLSNSRDNAARYAEAKRLSSRADTLLRGSASDQRLSVDLFRRAAELYSKSGARTELAATLNRIGLYYNSGGHRDSAMVYYRQALATGRAAGDRTQESMTLNGIGTVFAETGGKDSALAYHRQALSLARATVDPAREAEALSDIGKVFIDVGQPDSAFAYLRLALPIHRLSSNPAAEAGTLNRIGALFVGIGQPDSAVAYFRQALPIRRASGDRIGEGATLANIGTVYAGIGQPDSALAYFRQALPIRRAVGDHPGEARTLNNLGLMLAMIGQLDTALAYYRQALPIRRAVGDRAGEANTLANMGNVYSQVGQRDSAMALYREALVIRRAIGDRAGESVELDNIGLIFSELGRQDSALAYYRQGIAIGHDVRDRPGEAKALHNIGFSLSQLGQRDSALAYFRKALVIAHSAGDRAVESRTLANIAYVYRDVGQLDSSLAYFGRSAALSATIAKRAGSDFNQLSYNETTSETYADWALTWLALAPQSKTATAPGPRIDRAPAAYGALAAFEQGRARALLDLMHDSTAYDLRGAELPAEGHRLAAALRGSNSGGLVYFNTADTLVIWLVSSKGDVDVFRHPIARDTLVSLVGELRGDLGAEEGVARLPLRGGQLEAGAKQSVRATTSVWRRRAEELSGILLPPEVLRRLKTEKEVVIVAQGALALVPFAALPVDFADEPLGAMLAIRYAPSLTTLVQVEARPGLGTGPARKSLLRQALVVGNPQMPEVNVTNGARDRLASLPGAESESRTVAALLDTNPLIGPAATESEVVGRLPKATVVHLATHGFAYSTEAKARNSFVALGPDSTHDGLLTVAKILDNPQLQLTADLVVLSACQTGLGNLRQAEGTVGLQRAFLAKGARSVLVSLWSVSDVATQKLMAAFYQHWLHDTDLPSKAEALRRSQEDVRNTAGFDHPRFWAAFQLAGAK